MLTDHISEQICLGLMINNQEALDKGLASLEPFNFSSPNFQKLFSILFDFNESGKQVNVYSIQKVLKEYELNMSLEELISIEDKFYIPEKFDSLVENILDSSKRRNILEIMNGVSQKIRIDSDSIDKIIEPLSNLYSDVSNSNNINSNNYLEIRSQHDEYKNNSQQILCGISQIDDLLTYKFAVGEISIIAARPGNGKSAFKSNFIRNACHMGIGVGNYALEQTINVEYDRIEALESLIPSIEIAQKQLWPNDDPRHQKLKETRKRIQKDWNLETLEGTGKSTVKILNEMKSLAKTKNIRIFFFDLFDRLKDVSSATVNKSQVITKIMTQFLEVAKSANIHICLLVQINREAAKDKKNPRPSLHQLKEAGAYEEFARLVLLLHYPKAWDNTLLSSNIEVQIAKQNNGKLATIELKVNENIMKMENNDGAVNHGVSPEKIKKIEIKKIQPGDKNDNK